jgi:DNA replication and repair protein RecF
LGRKYPAGMHLKELTLLHFKNYPETNMVFHPKLNCLTGSNGMGKTNLLDAIHYLSFCKSYFNAVDSQSVAFNQAFFIAQGLFEKESREEEIFVSVKRGQKKTVKRNKNEYEKLSDHIGLFPLVMISPADTGIISGGSIERRRFTDSIISQFDKFYLDKLISYNHILQQRNALLKQFAITRTFDGTLLEILDEQVVTYGAYIHDARIGFLHDFIPVFEKFYQILSGNAEEVSLRYLSTLQGNDYKTALKQAIHKDCMQQHTGVGIHRDDLDFLLGGNEVKKYASQGQQKTYLLALKLGQYEYIKNKTGIKPLLLLDDIYDKLDNRRFEKLVELVSSSDFGQVFITDTHTDRMQQLFSVQKTGCSVFLVKQGLVEPVLTTQKA